MAARKRFEFHPLAAGKDRRQQTMGTGRDEKEVRLRGRLFERLQQRIGGGFVQPVGGVQDTDPSPALQRPETKLPMQLPDLVDFDKIPVRLDLNHIRMIGGVDFRTGRAGLAGLAGFGRREAVHSLSQSQSGQPLAHAVGARQEVRMGQAVVNQGLTKDLNGAVLSPYL